MIYQHFYESFPVIEFDDIKLREIREKDAADYLGYMNNNKMQPFITENNLPRSIEEATKEVQYWGSLFKNKQSFYWGIAKKNNNKLIGTVGFNNINFYHLRAEISYDLNPDYWSKGIMLKSIYNILQFADNVLDLVRIQATVIIDNYPSIKLLERSHFIKEGILKKYELVNNEYKDYYMYSRINPYKT